MGLVLAGLSHLPGLAWRPFLDPLPAERYWLWLFVPLVLMMSVVYKAVKRPGPRGLWFDSAFLAVQVSMFMGLLALLVWFVTMLA